MPIYEYECRECGKVFEKYSVLPHGVMLDKCPICGSEGDRLYSLSVPKMFEVFTTTNILPDGEPVTVRGASQLRQLENEHHVKMVDKDAPPPQTVFPEPVLGKG